jgi:carbon-monoxide dehydrogenase large subunit
MADGATYRAVFLRMHPTGKAVLSLSEASQGEEAKLAGIAAAELGIPPEDIKVVHEDTDRFGEGHSFNSEPSDAVGENVAATAVKLRDKAQVVAASMLGASPDALRFENGRWTVYGGDREGIEGSLDAQTTYRVDAVQAAG